MTEFLDVVDDDDRVVGRASRGECHKRRLPHRSVQFFIFDKKNRVLVNRRSSKKEFFGGLWSIVLGGHVASGDTYDGTVGREAQEEANVGSAPFRMGFFRKRLPEEMENVAVYGFVADGKPTLLAEEIEYGEFMTLAEAEERIKKEKFIPETAQLLPILRDYLSRR
jgi:isopentenyldiphosphate isomerase